MGKYFGTDGFRGEANVVLTVEHAFSIGRFLGWYFGKDHKARVVIGKDTRRSSYMFEDALSSGLTSSGADVYLLHVTTTPSVSYVTRTERFDCGIMISASHNVYYDNGIKLINGHGHKMESEVEVLIEEYLDGKGEKIPYALRDKIGRTVDYAAGRNRYIGHLISLATRSFKEMKVGLDCANGSAFSIGKSVFDALGAHTFVIHSEPDGTNINRECGSTHIRYLQNFVTGQKLDIGFAYDGDADRCLAVDEQGNIVDGDAILYICGKYMKERGRLSKDTIVTTVMSNLGFYQACDRAGIRYEQTAVGDKYVYESMMKNQYSLGGEQSGHVIFSKYATTGDGILTSLLLMEVMLEKKQPLSALAQEIEIFPQELVNVRVKDKRNALNNKAVRKALLEVETELGSEGRILVRESGTEPVIRVMAEAKDMDMCKRCVDKVVQRIKAEGLEDTNP